jgi:hypothetical protein
MDAARSTLVSMTRKAFTLRWVGVGPDLPVAERS